MKLFKLLLVLFCLVCSLSSRADTFYDWTSTSSGVYYYNDLGWYDNGFASGHQMQKVTHRLTFSFVDAPSSPLPADLPHLEGWYFYTLSSTGQLLWKSQIYAKAWNDTGDSLLAEGFAVSGSQVGSTFYYSNQYHFVGGTGAYVGAYGDWVTHGVIDIPAYTQTWDSTVHLGLPSEVSEPELGGLLLAGMGLLAASVRRRRRNAS